MISKRELTIYAEITWSSVIRNFHKIGAKIQKKPTTFIFMWTCGVLVKQVLLVAVYSFDITSQLSTMSRTEIEILERRSSVVQRHEISLGGPLRRQTQKAGILITTANMF